MLSEAIKSKKGQKNGLKCFQKLPKFLKLKTTLRSEIEIKDISKVLGHSKIETTENYYITSTIDSLKNENRMDNILIRRATINDLQAIQKLNNSLFELEKENYYSTIVRGWPLSADGKNYFEDLIKNNYVILAMVDDLIVGYLAGTINEKGSYEEIQYGESITCL